MEKPFSELNEKDKNDFCLHFSQGLPFFEYGVRKSMVEVNPIIMNADCRPDVMFVSGFSIKKVFDRLLYNSNLNEQSDVSKSSLPT